MPTYVYGPRLKDGEKRTCQSCSGTFEMMQRMSDEAMTHCPQCSGEIERIITPPMLNGAGKYKTPSADRLSKAGFTEYRRKGKGYYEKSFGKGPTSIHGDGEA